MKPNVAIYAGSFDPFTNGHLDLVERGSRLFDNLIIAIGVNSSKTPRYSSMERAQAIEDSIRHLSNVSVIQYADVYISDLCKEQGANYVLRGIRNNTDLEYERTFQIFCLKKGIETVFFQPKGELAEVSSSFVRGLIGYKGWQEEIKHYVPEPIYNMILTKERLV